MPQIYGFSVDFLFWDRFSAIIANFMPVRYFFAVRRFFMQVS
jgi:hypothetical protein